MGQKDTTGDNDNDDQNNDIHDPNDAGKADGGEYISRQALSDIAKWARSKQGSASLDRHALGESVIG